MTGSEARERGGRRGVVLAAVLLGALGGVYALSVPGSFNTVFEHRRYFDSDGEFIVRQFRQGKTFTHEDHLLYHVAGRALHAVVVGAVGEERGPVVAHKALSAVAGAAGVALLFAFGLRRTGDPVAAGAAAALVGGSAGWWFFAATIDTYLPSLACSVLALGLACEALRSQRLALYPALGAAAGLAFLFRTDGFLLASLAGVALARGGAAAVARRVAACGLGAALVAGVGYPLLATTLYDVPLAEVPSWAVGHADRPESEGGQWGQLENLDGDHLRRVWANQSVFTIVLPGLDRTRSPEIWRAMGATPHGRVALLAWGAFAAWAILAVLVQAARELRTGGRERAIAVALAVAWLGSRTLFYAWWDPWDPFLFAVMSVPAWWWVVIEFLAPSEHASEARLPAVLVVAGVVVAHNALALIAPLRALATT